MTRSPLDEAPVRFTAERRPLIAEARTYVAVCLFGAARAEQAEASRRPSNHDRPHT